MKYISIKHCAALHVSAYLVLLSRGIDAFSLSPQHQPTTPESRLPTKMTTQPFESDRRSWMTGIISIPIMTSVAFQANAADTMVVEMKDFVDPQGLFSIKVPSDFYTLRRSAKGDLPDAKTGKGRRGASIFTAGNMKKAEVVAVERFPTRVLLEENGIDASGSLSTFTDLGEPIAIAKLVNLRRERDKPGMSPSVIQPESVKLSDDKKVLTFTIKAEIEAQKPELLMETYGVDRLFRITLAKVSLRSNDGNMMGVFASALETDFNGPDGTALQESVDSFTPLEQVLTS